MKWIYGLVAGLTVFSVNSFAQQKINSQYFDYSFAPAGQVNVNAVTDDFFPHLQNLEMPKPGSNSYNDYLQKIKGEIKPERLKKDEVLLEMGAIQSPQKLSGFEVRAYSAGVPNDNDMAVSNGGQVVSVVNSSISILDSTGKLLKEISLEAFSGALNLKQDKYDPRVLYDPVADRFIVACLNGKDDSTSYIVLAFSKTNDATADWNLYTIPGEPLLDTTWSDYPILALHGDELFLTINSLQNNKSWQLGFRQSFIWQINKLNGYTGQPLQTRLHTAINFNGKPLRNICPVQGGSKPATGTAYFLSNRNFSAKNDSVFLMILDGDLQQKAVFGMQVLKAKNTYGVPPNATQIRDSFQTNDARVLDAIIENGKIQFVGNSVVKETGKAGVFHGIIYDPATKPFIQLNIMGHENLDFGYPSIAYAGMNDLDDDAIIFLNHSSDTAPAGNSVVFYRNEQYSKITQLVRGESYVNAMSGKSERWGDYSSTQRRYNHAGEVWVGGYTSYKKNIGAGNIQHLGSTYISQVQNPNAPYIPSAENALILYPSPANNAQIISIEFTAATNAYASIGIYDLSGKCLTTLLNDKVKQGRNMFSFVPANLRPGMYILQIKPDNSKAISEKFLVR